MLELFTMCEVMVDEASDEVEERLTQQKNSRNPNNLSNVTVLKQVFLAKTFVLTKRLIESTFLSFMHI